MRFGNAEFDVKQRIVKELPEVASNLMDITGFTEEEISRSLPVRPPFAETRIDTYDMNQLNFARLMGSVTWYAGTSYRDTMRSAIETSLVALVRVKNKIDRVTPHQQEFISQDLLLATRAVIAHTPYPQAFSRRQQHRANNSLQDRITRHAESYTGLLPFMASFQRKTTTKVLKTL